MGSVEVPVLIVGGGGCGLSASVFLSDQGVDHLLVERHPDTSRVPKAHYLNQRTMEIYRQHHVADDVLAEAAPLDKFGKVRWQTTLAGDGPLDRRLIHEMDAFGGGSLEPTYAAAGPLLPAKLPQMWLEPILRRHAEDRNPGRILFHHEMLSFTDEGDRVVAEVRNLDTGETTTVTSRYLIGADGGRMVAAAVGIEMQGPPAQVNTTTAYFSADLSAWWQEGTLITHFLSPEDPDLSSNLIEMGPSWGKDCEQWGLHFAPGPPGRWDAETVVPRIRELLRIPDLEMTVHKVTDWVVHAHLADRYRAGRVLIAGDAAHRQPPAVGLGLNTGIQDAHNLAWKLAATLNGWAPENLLDTYHTERHPVGAELIEQSRAQTALMTAFTTEGLALRSLLSEMIAEQPGFARALAERLTALSVRYPAGPTAHPLVGTRAPDLALTCNDVGLFALLRPDAYLLLDLTADGALGGLARPGLAVHPGRLDEPPAAWREVRAALIRPDGHVAWAGTEQDTPALPATLGAFVAT